MPKTARPTIAVEIRCCNCKTSLVIQRLIGRERKPGHVKHYWCCTCQDRTPHEELGRV